MGRTLRPPSPDERGFPLLGHVEDFIVGAHDLRAAQVAAVDDEPQFPSELVTPQLADRLSRMGADDLAEPPALAERRGWADPIRALKNVGWHAAMVTQARRKEIITP